IDAKECVKEMREAQEQSGHKLKNGFFRIEITPSKEEQATEWTEEQWQSVITDYCQRMGISNSQAIWFHHSRTDNDEQLPHVHGLVNRIDRNGNVLSDKYCQKRSIDVITKMTAERGFTTAEEISKKERETIKEKAHQALRQMKRYDFTSYVIACADFGITVRPNISPNGKRSGYYLSLEDSSREYKASTIDRALTDSRIVKTHYNEHRLYEQERRKQLERQKEQERQQYQKQQQERKPNGGFHL
ncbi:relaxase/mobilization nuclease domain-containing protein, partial [[Eubacterium] rectale]